MAGHEHHGTTPIINAAIFKKTCWPTQEAQNGRGVLDQVTAQTQHLDVDGERGVGQLADGLHGHRDGRLMAISGFGTRLKRGLFWSAVLAIGVLALLPGEHLQLPLLNWWDKAQHVLAFLVLTLLGMLAYSWAQARVLGGLLLYGVLIELAQFASGWRYGDWHDVLADAAGVFVGWGLIRWRY